MKTKINREHPVYKTGYLSFLINPPLFTLNFDN